MSDNKKHDKHPFPAGHSGLSQFEPGGPRGPIEDPAEYAALVEQVADPDQREFLRETSRFATTLEYLTTTLQIGLPSEICSAVQRLQDQSLPIAERIRLMRDANQSLTEFIHSHDGKDSGIRQ